MLRTAARRFTFRKPSLADFMVVVVVLLLLVLLLFRLSRAGASRVLSSSH